MKNKSIQLERALLVGLIGTVATTMNMPLPMMGMGFFATLTPQPLQFIVGALIGHLIYETIFGKVARQHRRLSEASN